MGSTCIPAAVYDADGDGGAEGLGIEQRDGGGKQAQGRTAMYREDGDGDDDAGCRELVNSSCRLDCAANAARHRGASHPAIVKPLQPPPLRLPSLRGSGKAHPPAARAPKWGQPRAAQTGPGRTGQDRTGVRAAVVWLGHAGRAQRRCAFHRRSVCAGQLVRLRLRLRLQHTFVFSHLRRAPRRPHPSSVVQPPAPGSALARRNPVAFLNRPTIYGPPFTPPLVDVDIDHSTTHRY